MYKIQSTCGLTITRVTCLVQVHDPRMVDILSHGGTTRSDPTVMVNGGWLLIVANDGSSTVGN